MSKPNATGNVIAKWRALLENSKGAWFILAPTRALVEETIKHLQVLEQTETVNGKSDDLYRG